MKEDIGFQGVGEDSQEESKENGAQSFGQTKDRLFSW